jgi:plasmid maintenance system antidote protein VapI
MEKVKKLIDAGASIPTAIKEALGMELKEFAERHEVSRAGVSNAINGTVRPTDRIIDAFIAELGGTPDEWRELLWLAGRPANTTAA